MRLTNSKWWLEPAKPVGSDENESYPSRLFGGKMGHDYRENNFIEVNSFVCLEKEQFKTNGAWDD